MISARQTSKSSLRLIRVSSASRAIFTCAATRIVLWRRRLSPTRRASPTKYWLCSISCPRWRKNSPQGCGGAPGVDSVHDSLLGTTPQHQPLISRRVSETHRKQPVFLRGQDDKFQVVLRFQGGSHASFPGGGRDYLRQWQRFLHSEAQPNLVARPELPAIEIEDRNGDVA